MGNGQWVVFWSMESIVPIENKKGRMESHWCQLKEILLLGITLDSIIQGL